MWCNSNLELQRCRCGDLDFELRGNIALHSIDDSRAWGEHRNPSCAAPDRLPTAVNGIPHRLCCNQARSPAVKGTRLAAGGTPPMSALPRPNRGSVTYVVFVPIHPRCRTVRLTPKILSNSSIRLSWVPLVASTCHDRIRSTSVRKATVSQPLGAQRAFGTRGVHNVLASPKFSGVPLKGRDGKRRGLTQHR
jgi:hypothetical protein